MPETRCEPTPPIPEAYGGQPSIQDLRGTLGFPPKLTRVRYGELTAISQHLCETLEKMGVKPQEGCIVREITERLWGLR